MAELKVIAMPPTAFADIPAGLRQLADDIEAGSFGQVFNVAWVLNSETSEPVELGLLGRAASPDALFITLAELAKLKLLQNMGV